MKQVKLLFCFLALVLSLQAERLNQKITITAGTPVRLSVVPGKKVERILIQMQVAASGGLGYVMVGVTQTSTPVANTFPGTVQLCAGTSTAPGCNYSDVGSNIDLSQIWIDGSHTGDTVTVSYELR